MTNQQRTKMKIKQQIEQEASTLALQLYNITLEKDRVEKRLQELSIALNTIAAVEQQAVEESEQEAIKSEKEEG